MILIGKFKRLYKKFLIVKENNIDNILIYLRTKIPILKIAIGTVALKNRSKRIRTTMRCINDEKME